MPNLVGQRFGRWTVIEPSKNKGRYIYYYCRCDCGKCKDVYAPNLVKGKSLSCGCLSAEVASKRSLKDLTGMRFNRLTVIRQDGINKQGNCTWLCRCECGSETVVSSTNLLTNHTQSCGCLGQERRVERRRKHLLGMRFGKLVVIKELPDKKPHSIIWLCQCDCGNTTELSSASLIHGTRSCGCLIHDVLIERNTTHGMTGTTEYNRMRSRQRKERRKKLDVNWDYEKEKALREFYTHCVVCGETKDLQVDHVRPLDKGYGLEPGNATILCKFHNDTKKAKMPEDLPEPMRSLILDSAKKFKEYWEWLQGGALDNVTTYSTGV